MACFLYRHYDGSGILLYVGISINALVRHAGHERHAGWWGTVRRIEITPYPNRAEAARAEIQAIREERPRWNQQHVEPATKERPPVAADDAGKALFKRLQAGQRKAVDTGMEDDSESFADRAAA